MNITNILSTHTRLTAQQVAGLHPCKTRKGLVGLLFSSLSNGTNCHYGSPIKSSSQQRQQPRQKHSFYSTRSYHDNDDYDDTAPYSKTALVVGSSGSLGRTLTKYLSKDLQVKVIGADVVAPSSNDEQYLEGFVTMPLPTDESAPSSLPDLTMALVDGLSQLLADDENATDLDAIISVAGGWEGDPELPPPNADGLDRLEGARQYGMTIERMMGKNLYPLLAAGYAAHHFMTDHDGLLVAIGATAALGGTPGMMGYGLSKVATHHFVQSLGELTTKSVTTKTKRQLARRLRKHVADDAKYLNTMSVIGILPTVIDTPMNREAMPDADFSQWTKSIDIAKEIGMWIEQPMLRPHSGSLVKVFPDINNGKGATFKLVR